MTDLAEGREQRLLLAKLLLEKPDILLLDEPTNYLDEEHIAWLKRYLLDYENAFILISHDIPFFKPGGKPDHHMENQELEQICGRLRPFSGSLRSKKSPARGCLSSSTAGDQRTQKDFVARNKARVSTRNMAMSRQKKLDKMDVIELWYNESRNLISATDVLRGKCCLKLMIW